MASSGANHEVMCSVQPTFASESGCRDTMRKQRLTMTRKRTLPSYGILFILMLSSSNAFSPTVPSSLVSLGVNRRCLQKPHRHSRQSKYAGATLRPSLQTAASDVNSQTSDVSQSFNNTTTPSIVHDRITRVDQAVIVGTSIIAILVCAGVLSASGPGGWRYYLAGGICAATAHAIATPIDVVKVRSAGID